MEPCRASLVVIALGTLIWSPQGAAALAVGVTGGTGKLGRAAVQILSRAGTPVRVLSRHPLDPSVAPDASPDASPAAVTAYLASLPHVELVPGDATDAASVSALLDGCSACLALHGATRRRKLLDLLQPWKNPADTDPSHARSVNYEAVKHILAAARREGSECRRVVRVTGKGETPWSIFSILINGLGSMAKAWNYVRLRVLNPTCPKPSPSLTPLASLALQAGETLLRDPALTGKDVSFTIVRPGIMMTPSSATSSDASSSPSSDASAGAGRKLALSDNGGDLTVAPIAHSAIAQLCVECLSYENAAGTTLTAMTVPAKEEQEGTGAVHHGLDPKTSAKRYTADGATEVSGCANGCCT